MPSTSEFPRCRIAVITALLDPRYGGPAAVIRSHAEALRNSAAVSIYGVAESAELASFRAEFPQGQFFPRAFPRRWFRSRGLARAIRQAATRFDILHAHMLWDHPVWAAAQAAASPGPALVITPHGSVSAPWRQSGLHKRLYHRLVLDRILRRTACLHALTGREAEALREFSGKTPVRVVPNGIPERILHLPRGREAAEEFWPVLRDRRIALYLGRLWGEKGLDILPEAWRRAAPGDDWVLVLAGPDYRGYETVLRARMSALGLQRSILLTGAVAAERKEALLSAASLFLLPSRGEALSMALLEAAGAGIPALYTAECGFPELAAAEGGWEIPYDSGALADSLGTILRKSPDTLHSRGSRARLLARTGYSMAQVAGQLLMMYRDAVQARGHPCASCF